MFLWILEEFVYILGLLHKDRDRHMVLGHELLLLTCSRCCSKRRGGRGLCHISALSIDLLPACSLDTLECTVWALKDTMSLECLTWEVYNNLLVPGQSLLLSGFNSYGQVVQHLVDKVYKGLHSQCLSHTSAVFEPYGESQIHCHGPAKILTSRRTQNDVGHEFAKGDQATGQLDPVLDALKWMWECQCFYTEEQLNFWILLWPLTNGGEVSSWHLACQLLSVWHWVLALNPLTYPPAPSQLNIGHWIQEHCNVNECQKWIEAYAASSIT